MIGFVTAIVGMIVGMVVSSIVFGATPLVSIIGAFFTGGVAGILGNSGGGRRGAIISGLLYGFLLIFMSGALHHYFDLSSLGVVGVGHDCIDVIVFIFLFKNPIIGLSVFAAGYIFLSIKESNYYKNIG